MEQIVERTADDRGWITLGARYAGQDVEVAVLEPEDG
jgi:hypothetical protein